MKKLLILSLLGIAAYGAYRYRESVAAKKGAFDEQGNPTVIVFVGGGRAGVSPQLATTLAQRRIDYEVVEFAADTESRYGVRGYPTTLVGNRKVEGDDIDRIVSLLAETYGDRVLTRLEQLAMAGHFDADGRPVVVLYGTQWCPYCTRLRTAFAENKIAFRNVDIDTSPEGKQAFEALGGRGVPLVYVGYRRFGNDEAGIKAAIADLM